MHKYHSRWDIRIHFEYVAVCGCVGLCGDYKNGQEFTRQVSKMYERDALGYDSTSFGIIAQDF